MIVKTKSAPRYRRRCLMLLLLGIMLFSTVMNADAQKPKKVLRRSVSSSMPNGYSQVGNTDLCYRVQSYSIDIQGKYNDRYYGSTYSNGGYKVAMKVGEGSAVNLNCLDGSTIGGVKFETEVIAQAELARVCYYITNTNDRDTIISLGIHADVMIGNNDRAPIVRKIDTIGNTYGLALLDGNGAQLCVLFGSGLPGVTGVSDFWFGYYYTNTTADNMVGNYYQGNNWMIENGSYDSGMGWCWKNRIIPAGETVTFSWLIGVGDVKLEPNSTFEVTPEDPEGWNDLSRLHVLALEGNYESPAGLKGKIEYAVEDSEEWIALTEMLESGSTFNDTVKAMFNPELSSHAIRFRTVDQVGNTTLLPSIVYPDVAFHPVTGIEDKVFTGDSIFQTNLICDLDADRITTKNYRNNINVGTATFNVEGVFPYTIGRKSYTFEITPAPLTGDISILSTQIVYSGKPIEPEWSFTETAYANLESETDYTAVFTNNILPGTATLKVTGKGNYKDTLTKTFVIDKAPLPDSLYQTTLPQKEIIFDEEEHPVTVFTAEGVGSATISYEKDGSAFAGIPSDPGEYQVFLEISEGTLFYGKSKFNIGSFSIYRIDETDWQNLQTLVTQLTGMGWTQPWDLSQGIKVVASLTGLSTERGRVTELDFSNQGLTGSFPTSILLFPSLTSLDISGNNLTGNIGEALSGTVLPNLTVLKASDNQFSDVNPILPSTITTLDLTNQAVSEILENNTGAIAINEIPSILLYNHTGQTLHTEKSVRLTNYPPTVDETAYLEYKPFWGATINNWGSPNPELSSLSTNNTYYGESGDILYLSYPSASSEVANSYCQLKYTFSNGDVNMDSFVNILDLQATINYMFDEYIKPFNYTAANQWTDDIINVQDVVVLVNQLLETNVSASSREYLLRRAGTEEQAEASVYCENGQLILQSSKDVASFDILINGLENLQLADELKLYGISCQTKVRDNEVHLIGYSLVGGCLPTGNLVIGQYEQGSPVVIKALLSDKRAQIIHSTINSDLSTTVKGLKGNNANFEERYRLMMGRNRVVVIDSNGNKTITKDVHTSK